MALAWAKFLGFSSTAVTAPALDSEISALKGLRSCVFSEAGRQEESLPSSLWLKKSMIFFFDRPDGTLVPVALTIKA